MYSYHAVDNAATRGQLNLMQWWWDKRDLLPFKYNHAIESASTGAHLNILDWFFDHRDEIEFKYDDTIDQISCYGHVHVLDWWYEHRNDLGAPLQYSVLALDNATSSNRVDILNWWYDRKNDIELKLPYNLDSVGSYGSIDALKWWIDHQNEFELKYTDSLVVWASEYGHVEILQFLLDNDLELKSNHFAIENAVRKEQVHSLQWWLDNKDRVKIPPHQAFQRAYGEGKTYMMDWLFDHRDEFYMGDFEINPLELYTSTLVTNPATCPTYISNYVNASFLEFIERNIQWVASCKSSNVWISPMEIVAIQWCYHHRDDLDLSDQTYALLEQVKT